MGQIWRQFCTLSPSIRTVHLKSCFCRNILCYLSERFVKDFNGSKRIKDRFNVFIFCVLKKRCLQILTICLQVNFYQINFIQWFYENGWSKDKVYPIKTNNFEHDIIRVRDFWSGDFQQNAYKDDFILKGVYIETLVQNLTL